MLIRILTLGLLFLFASGCGSAWQRAYESRSASAVSRLPASVPVVVREVPWPRLEQALTELAQRRTTSDVHYDDWSLEDKRAADAVLLRALQVPEPHEEFEILGRSSLKTTDRLQPMDGSLEKFARSVGATHVIWGARVVGKTDKVVREPVQHTGFRPIEYYDRSNRRYRTRYEFDDWTTYVPVVVEADETAWVVYYLRK